MSNDNKTTPVPVSEILKYNYWEHIKAEKDLSFVLPPEHPRRIEIHKSAEEILNKISEYNNQNNSK